MSYEVITLAMRIKEVMSNMPISLNTKKEIDEYFKNAMKNMKKEKVVKVVAAKPVKPAKAAKKATSLPKQITIIDNKPQVISTFTKDIAITAELLRNNKELIKKRRFYLYRPAIVSKRQSFCDEIIATAYRINKRLREQYII
jgi:carboxylesterase type B